MSERNLILKKPGKELNCNYNYHLVFIEEIVCALGIQESPEYSLTNVLCTWEPEGIHELNVFLKSYDFLFGKSEFSRFLVPFRKTVLLKQTWWWAFIPIPPTLPSNPGSQMPFPHLFRAVS